MTGTTSEELLAAQACLRLLHTARAALSDAAEVPPAAAATLLAGPIAEADAALRRAGLTGNEAALIDRIYDLSPHPPAVPPAPPAQRSPQVAPARPREREGSQS
ncbi:MULTISPECIES: hypothetical protein [unclassified Streptomyces]|uniref:hypothetical protein n=1 Tax=unclassified Streptomyces TaxID=2593676 RepID=UPI0007C700FE|nr:MULTISPECIES: hypothetical protein [unclassified Streptomyces]THC48708.1 hypothetical protein E7X58_23660 [Streptomyces sp. A1499]